MNIGIVLSRPPSYSETFFNSKIKGLMSKGHQVILFVQDNPNKYNQCKVICAPKVPKIKILLALKYILVFFKIILFPKRLYRFVSLENKSRRSKTQISKNLFNNSHILTAKLDWLHFGFATMALQSENVANAIDAKMAVSVRGFDIDVFPLKHKACYDLLWKTINKIHAISNYTLKRAYAIGLPKQSMSKIITPAVDVSKFNQPVTHHQKNHFKFLTVVRLHWIKGIDYTLEALSILKKEGVSFEYHIIGSGEEFEKLKFAAYQLDLLEQVNFLGQIPHDQINLNFKKADLYLQYSDSEGFCNAVLEAQAMGLLSIVSDGGALPENIVNNETGWIVPKRNPKALAQKILEVINLSDTKKNKISKQAIKRVQDDFNLKEQEQKFIAFYE